MFYEVQPFPMSPAFDLLLRFFKDNERYSMQLTVKNKFQKELIDIYSYGVDFEVVDVA